MKRTIAVTAFLLSFSVAAGAAGTSGAATGGASMGADHSAQFKTLDTNGDGVISKEEAKKDAKLSGNFSTLDKNQDGRLDNTEFAQSQMGDRSRGAGGTQGSSDEFMDQGSGSGASPDSRMDSRPGSGTID